MTTYRLDLARHEVDLVVTAFNALAADPDWQRTVLRETAGVIEWKCFEGKVNALAKRANRVGTLSAG